MTAARAQGSGVEQASLFDDDGALAAEEADNGAAERSDIIAAGLVVSSIAKPMGFRFETAIAMGSSMKSLSARPSG